MTNIIQLWPIHLASTDDEWVAACGADADMLSEPTDDHTAICPMCVRVLDGRKLFGKMHEHGSTDHRQGVELS